MNDRFTILSDPLARILMAVIFVVAGVGKLTSWAGTGQFMEANGVPGLLLGPTIALELGGGLLLAIGLFTRPVALALAVFTVVAGLIFHWGPDQQVMLMKNVAMAGGLLAMAGHGATGASVDGVLRRRA